MEMDAFISCGVSRLDRIPNEVIIRRIIVKQAIVGSRN